MKYELIKEQFKSDFKNSIENLLNGAIDIVEADSLPPVFVINILNELGVDIDISNMDTNGWQLDYCINFIYKEKRYIIRGSGYYGDLKVQENTDDDEYECNEVQEIKNKETELCTNIVDLLNEADRLLQT